MPSPASAPKAPGISDTLKRLLALSIDSAQGRFELVQCELGDERARLGQLLTRGLFAGFMIFLTVQLLAVLVVALAWDTNWRIPVVVGLVTTSMVVTILMIRSYQATPGSTLFDASVEEIAKDVRTIEGRA